MATADPRQLIDDLPVRPAQVAAGILCVLINARDGFDVVAVSFASPGTSADCRG